MNHKLYSFSLFNHGSLLWIGNIYINLHRNINEFSHIFCTRFWLSIIYFKYFIISMTTLWSFVPSRGPCIYGASSLGCAEPLVSNLELKYALETLMKTFSLKNFDLKNLINTLMFIPWVTAQAMRWPGILKVARSRLTECRKSCDLHPVLHSKWSSGGTALCRVGGATNE